MKFTDFPFNQNILKGIEDAGFTDCMPVQEATFAHSLLGKDVCAQSQTGTGKTVAFLLSIFHLFSENESMKGGKALIVVPTRELADQIEQEALLLSRHLPFRVGAFYGGVSYNKQEKLLEEGVDVFIGTPGRLLDFGSSGKIKFGEFTVLVIDEADRLFDMGFYPDIKRMLRKMKSPKERLTMLFSATLGDKVMFIARDHMNEPEEVVITPENLTVDNVVQQLYHVGKKEKFPLLLGILEKEKPANAIIFTNTKRAAVEIATRLGVNGYSCEYIIGDLPQSKRLKIIEDLKSGAIPFLVATNVAARGLHIDDLDLVVNYDLPFDREDYVHRIGRTARAGKSGLAISLACEEYVYGLEAIEEFTKIKIPVEWPDETMFPVDKSAGMRISGYRNRDRNDSRDRRDRPDQRRRKPGEGAQGERPARRPQRETSGTATARPSRPLSSRPAPDPTIKKDPPVLTVMGEEAPAKKKRKRKRKPRSAAGEAAAAPAAARPAAARPYVRTTSEISRPKARPAQEPKTGTVQDPRSKSARTGKPQEKKTTKKKSFISKLTDVIMGRYDKKKDNFFD